MPGIGVCPAASVGWFGGKICGRALPMRWLGKAGSAGAGSKDTSASGQGAAGGASAPATGADGDGEARARGQRVQTFPCSCPAICDAGLVCVFF